nr:MAG TPA: hypothetical protein [Caudoviricetes sp.]
MGLNRILMKTNGSVIEGEGEFIMTMGQQSSQYGYSRYNATFGEVEGNVKHDGKAITLVMLSYYGGWLDFAFRVEGVTGGKYNVTVKVTSTETNENVRINFSSIQYQSNIPSFYGYTNKLPSEVATMFNGKNVGKKYRVEIIFN